MNIGMLWFDNDPKVEITIKVERAACYYRQKYGRPPNLCYVHPSMLRHHTSNTFQKQIKSGDIEVRTSRRVLPNHLWIGVNPTGTIEP